MEQTKPDETSQVCVWAGGYKAERLDGSFEVGGFFTIAECAEDAWRNVFRTVLRNPKVLGICLSADPLPVWVEAEYLQACKEAWKRYGLLECS